MYIHIYTYACMYNFQEPITQPDPDHSYDIHSTYTYTFDSYAVAVPATLTTISRRTLWDEWVASDSSLSSDVCASLRAASIEDLGLGMWSRSMPRKKKT